MSNHSAQTPSTTGDRGAWNAFDRIALAASAFLIVVLLTLPSLASDLRAALSDMGRTLPWFTRWATNPVIPRLLATAAVVPLLLALYRRAWRRRALIAALITASLAVAICVFGLIWPLWVLSVTDTYDGQRL